MAKKVARVGDSVQYTCICGDKVVSGIGTIITGSSDTFNNGKQISRDGDQAECGCCGVGRIVATSKNDINGKKIARVGDTVILPTGSGTIIQGSSDSESD
jgi:uncharacterized Zn-binding protein involved in type VI secretion